MIEIRSAGGSLSPSRMQGIAEVRTARDTTPKRCGTPEHTHSHGIEKPPRLCCASPTGATDGVVAGIRKRVHAPSQVRLIQREGIRLVVRQVQYTRHRVGRQPGRCCVNAVRIRQTRGRAGDDTAGGVPVRRSEPAKMRRTGSEFGAVRGAGGLTVGGSGRTARCGKGNAYFQFEREAERLGDSVGRRARTGGGQSEGGDSVSALPSPTDRAGA